MAALLKEWGLPVDLGRIEKDPSYSSVHFLPKQVVVIGGKSYTYAINRRFCLVHIRGEYVCPNVCP
jgi:hypothetical protein